MKRFSDGIERYGRSMLRPCIIRLRASMSGIMTLALLAGCGGDAADDLAVAKIDTLPNGRIQVTNTGPTEWKPEDGWHFAEVLTMQPPEESPGELTDIDKVVADSEGNIYVFQGGPRQLKKYGADGQWIMNIGREGDGPGEYRAGMFSISRDTLVVQDPINSRFTTFTTGGDFIATHRSQCCFWTSSFPVLEDGTMLIAGPMGDAGGAQYRTRLDGTVLDTIPMGAFTPPDASRSWTATMKIGSGTSMYMTNIPNQPREVRKYRSDGRTVGGNTDSYSFAIQSMEKDTLTVFTAPATPRTMTQAEIDSLFEAEIEGIDAQWRDALREVAKKSDIPAAVPAWSDIAFDRTGRMYVGIPAPGTNLGHIDVFSPAGILLGRVAAPNPKILDGYFTTNRVYLADEDEDGFPVIRVYELKENR